MLNVTIDPRMPRPVAFQSLKFSSLTSPEAGKLAFVLNVIVQRTWSCSPCPTGRSATTGIDSFVSWSRGPMPDNMRICGDDNEPAEMITSLEVKIRDRFRSGVSYSTPTALVPAVEMVSSDCGWKAVTFGDDFGDVSHENQVQVLPVFLKRLNVSAIRALSNSFPNSSLARTKHSLMTLPLDANHSALL